MIALQNFEVKLKAMTGSHGTNPNLAFGVSNESFDWLDGKDVPHNPAGEGQLNAYFLIAEFHPSPPAMPNSFYGSLTLNGQPAPFGTKVEIRGGNIKRGVTGNPIFTTLVGQYALPGPDNPKLVAQGYEENEGTELTFWANDMKANQKAWFTPGSRVNLNLVVPLSTPIPLVIPESGVKLDKDIHALAEAATWSLHTDSPEDVVICWNPNDIPSFAIITIDNSDMTQVGCITIPAGNQIVAILARHKYG